MIFTLTQIIFFGNLHYATNVMDWPPKRCLYSDKKNVTLCSKGDKTSVRIHLLPTRIISAKSTNHRINCHSMYIWLWPVIFHTLTVHVSVMMLHFIPNISLLFSAWHSWWKLYSTKILDTMQTFLRALGMFFFRNRYK